MSGRLAGLIGWPVAHSVSPVMHTHWLQEHGLKGAYVPLPTRPEDFARVIDALPRAGFAGINITVPHKEAAYALCATLDDDARACGAVNTYVFANGAIAGRNTDITGFCESLTAAFGPDAVKKPAVVLGAGGAARAIIVGLAKLGCPEIRIVNRTQTRADALAKTFASMNARAEGWGAWEKNFSGAGVLVNTTSMGMTGHDDADVPLDGLPKTACVMDIVYNPLETPLMKRARARGHQVEGGLGMLMHQAVPAFASWFGVTPQVTPELRAKLERAIA